MKVTFEFETNDENCDLHELARHYYANDMAVCLNAITNQLRNWEKYDERSTIPTDEVFDKIWDIIQDNVDMERIGD